MKKTQRSWNSTLRKRSPKRAAADRKVAPERKAYSAEFLICQCCNKRKAVDVHEIARGSHRAKAVVDPATWLALCRQCHEELGDYSKWPIVRQLALKLVNDPGRFDLGRINEIRGRSDGAITLEDVSQYLEVK